MASTISPSSLKENTIVKVMGKVDFARVTSKVEGEALNRANANRQKFGLTPYTAPYITITVSDAKIVPADHNGTLNLEERYIQEKFYSKKNNPGALCYQYTSPYSGFPKLYQPDAKRNDSLSVEEVPPKGEPATGMTVVLILRIYKPKNYQHRGVALDGVIAQGGPMKFYEGGGRNQLANAGFVVTSTLTDEERNAAHQAAQNAPKADIPADDEPVNSPVSAPTGNALSSDAQGAAQPAYVQTPVANAMPAPTPVATQAAPATPVTPISTATADDGTWTCPECGAQTSGKFCNNCGHKHEEAAPAAPANPYTTPDVQSQVEGNGIKWDPNDNNRSY